MKIATWNVNSIKVRLEHLIKWMDLARIDAVVLQETKTVDELFPLAELQAAGFDAVFLGQKTYNGVALVTRKSTIRLVSDVVYNIPGYPDEQKRMIAADIEHVSGTKLRFAGVYVPNGTELGSNRYLYKLDWMSALTTWVREQLQSKTPLHAPETYSWWDYRQAGFEKNHGLRIDHVLASFDIAERIGEVTIDTVPRAWEKPSDHAPVVVVID